MLYYLALLLKPYIGAMNVFSYHTVRAGGAAITGFIFCLLVGPWLIERLRALKIGQYIRKEHVEDLHQLHKGKAGTPTMGGTMIILSTLLSLALWGKLSNRLLLLCAGVLLLLGAVGFMDDFIKLRRKHNMGLSARAKFAGQILCGLFLGLYLVYNPITVSATYVYPRDVVDWQKLAQMLVNVEASPKNSAPSALWGNLDKKAQEAAKTIAASDTCPPEARRDLLQGINHILGERRLYDARFWPPDALVPEARDLLKKNPAAMNDMEVVRLDRLLLESALPGALAKSVPNLHTKVGIPGFKDVFIPLGALFYVLFVIFLMVAISNAVNITDGLDGLAAGASIASILTYAGIAYVVSRADWSQYLYLTYVPEASELFVFGTALLGTGLGFLWFNAHPAEVFMGDTGSLALGGAIGAMALLTKQELLLPLVAGLFVIEVGSVVLQIASYKLTGKRVFRMAPLHHHFELLGWSETKVTIRFWILALLLALMSFSTLKLR